MRVSKPERVSQKQTKGAKDNPPFPSLFVTFAAFYSRIS